MGLTRTGWRVCHLFHLVLIRNDALMFSSEGCYGDAHRGNRERRWVLEEQQPLGEKGVESLEAGNMSKRHRDRGSPA